jgi:MinD superfamily P-loop ATPase
MSYVITEDCDCCGNCVDECAIRAITEGEMMYVINQELCVECGDCSYICDKGAIVME